MSITLNRVFLKLKPKTGVDTFYLSQEGNDIDTSTEPELVTISESKGDDSGNPFPLYMGTDITENVYVFFPGIYDNVDPDSIRFYTENGIYTDFECDEQYVYTLDGVKGLVYGAYSRSEPVTITGATCIVYKNLSGKEIVPCALATKNENAKWGDSISGVSVINGKLVGMSGMFNRLYAIIKSDPEGLIKFYLKQDKTDGVFGFTSPVYLYDENGTLFNQPVPLTECYEIYGLYKADNTSVEYPKSTLIMDNGVASGKTSHYIRLSKESGSYTFCYVKAIKYDGLMLYLERFNTMIENSQYRNLFVFNNSENDLSFKGGVGVVENGYPENTEFKIEKVFKFDGSEIASEGLSVISNNGYLKLKNETGSGLSIYRLLVSVIMPITFTAYSRSASYQSSNQTLQTSVYTTIYEPGSNNVVAGDTHKDYEIIGMWNAAGAELDYNRIGLSCFLVSGNPRIRIYNQSGSTRSWNHIEYKAYDVFRFYNANDKTDYTLKGTKAAYNRNMISTIERTANETYTIVGTYMADGTQIQTPADLEVHYNSSLKQIKISTQYEHTFAYVDVVVTGGDAPATADMLSLNNDE